MKTTTCNRCGKTNLKWETSKAGKHYLTDAEATSITNTDGKAIKTIRPAHQCLTPEQQEISTGFQQAADHAHLLEAKRDRITAQILALLSDEGDLADDVIAVVRDLNKHRAEIAGEIQALQVKFNEGWVF